MSHPTSFLHRVVPGILLIAFAGSCLAQCGSLVDGSFEDLALRDFYDVVDPRMTPGFWADENSVIVGTASCPGVTPFAGSKVLEVSDAFGNISEIWQAIPVGPELPTSITVSAWFSACEGVAPPTTISLRTLSNATSWPEYTSNYNAHLVLDTSAATWEQIVLETGALPEDAEWLLIVIYMHEDELGTLHGYVDDVRMQCHFPVSATETSWGRIKALFGG